MKAIINYKVRNFVLAAALSVGLGFVPAAFASFHSFIVDSNSKAVVDIGSLGGVDAFARGINDAERAVGQSDSHAFISGANGVGLNDLGTLGGLESMVYGVNNAGRVVGAAQISPLPEQSFSDFMLLSPAQMEVAWQTLIHS